MLKIKIVSEEGFDEETQTFVEIDSVELRLQHSLVSISKWESKWEKPFIGVEKTSEETLDYIKCMALNEIPDLYYSKLTSGDISRISEYINSSHTATTMGDVGKKRGGSVETVTSELIYYWMLTYQIPFECQTWHLNRLMTLIQVCSIKNQPEKKMTKREILERNKALNEARRSKYKTKG